MSCIKIYGSYRATRYLQKSRLNYRNFVPFVFCTVLLNNDYVILLCWSMIYLCNVII